MSRNYNPRACIYCHQKFIPRYENQVTCMEQTCSRISDIAEYIEINQVMESLGLGQRVCPYCKLSFMPRRKNQVICNSAECVEDHRQRLQFEKRERKLLEAYINIEQWLSPAMIAKTYRLHRQNVTLACRDGRLERHVDMIKTVTGWLISPESAFRLWGYRLKNNLKESTH